MKIMLAAAALAAFTVAVPASAADKSHNITYSDLDLASEGGQAALGKRLGKAAERKCGRIGGDISANAMTRNCQKKEIARLRAAISAERQSGS